MGCIATICSIAIPTVSTDVLTTFLFQEAATRLRIKALACHTDDLGPNPWLKQRTFLTRASELANAINSSECQ